MNPHIAETRDMERLAQSPTALYEEGLRFFRGDGMINETLRQLARDLDTREIAYAVIGAIALNQHGYARFTHDIDLLMTPESWTRFRNELVGRGYRPAFEGATKKFRATAFNIPIEIITSGEFPGDGKPRSIVFPDPADVSVEIEGVKTVALNTLIELKLASGMTGLGRRKDLADVQELIRALDLPATLAGSLDVSVRAMFLELHDELRQARELEREIERESD